MINRWLPNNNHYVCVMHSDATHIFVLCSVYHGFFIDPDLHQYFFFFPDLPSVCPSIGGNVVREPALRRRARAPASPLFTSSGSAGGLGTVLNASSASQGTGNFGFWRSTNITAAWWCEQWAQALIHQWKGSRYYCFSFIPNSYSIY